MHVLLSLFLFLFLTVIPSFAANYTPYTRFTFPAGTYSDMTMYTKWMTVPTGSAIYAAYDFYFQTGANAYTGTQIYSTGEKKAIFSIWDTDGMPQTSLPHDSWCKRFDHEGLGSQCIIDYPWVANREYKIDIRRGTVSATSVVWEGYITDTVTGIQTKIGSHELKNVSPHQGFGFITSNPLTFHEYWLQGPEPCSTHPYSKIQWRGPYTNQGQLLAARASTFYNDCVETNTTSPMKGTTIVEVGPGTVKTNPNLTVLWDTPTIPPPSVPPTLTTTPPTPTGPSCKMGDANGDGTVALSDFALWRSIFLAQ